MECITYSEGRLDQSSVNAKTWKHLNSVHKDFASNIRNVYLGLCTDRFSPFGMSGRQYSLLPVRTPHNLPPEICMEREFLFMRWVWRKWWSGWWFWWRVILVMSVCNSICVSFFLLDSLILHYHFHYLAKVWT